MAYDKKDANSKAAEQQRQWTDKMTDARKCIEKWHDQGDKIIDKYLDKRASRGFDRSARRLNLFYSITNNLQAMLFARVPKPEVVRRFSDPNDQIGRVASNVLRRAIVTESDTEGYFTTTAKDILKDRLLPGAGVAWVRYVPEVRDNAQPLQISDDLNEELSEEQQASPIITDEHTPAEHVHWKDFRWSKARTWNEVEWVARRAYLSKDEFKERFPKAKKMSKAEMATSFEGYKAGEENEDEIEVWEIWDKPSKKVYFYADCYHEILEVKDDPYGLPHFFPCPKPLFANVTTGSLVPTPDYVLVQDQYEALNVAVARKAHLVDSCKVAGVYDAENDRIKDVMEQPEGVLVPVQNWFGLKEKGGLAGSIEFVPLTAIAENIGRLNAEIEALKSQIAEITGISDIVRGSTSPYETAQAQGMKAQFASIRLQSLQQEIAEFFGEMFSIKAFLMAKFYAPEVLIRKAGTLPEADRQYLLQAIDMLKDELLAHTNVEVSVDALQAPNQQQLAQETAAVMTSLSNLIGQAFPVIQAMPESKSMFLMLAKKSVSTMPGAREIEGAIDQELTRLLGDPEGGQKQPDPAAEQAKRAQELQAQQMQQQAEIEQAKTQAVLQAKQMELEAAKQELELKKGENQAKGQIAKTELEIKARELRLREIEALTKAHEQGLHFDMSELELPLGSGLESDREGEMATWMQFAAQMRMQQQQFMAQQQAQFAQLVQALTNAPSQPEVVQFSHDQAGDVRGAAVIPIR